MIGLTAHQARLLDAIRSYTAQHGRSPTFDEMRALTGIATRSNISAMLSSLQQRGHIRRRKGATRAIDILEPAYPAPGLVRRDRHGAVVEIARLRFIPVPQIQKDAAT